MHDVQDDHDIYSGAPSTLTDMVTPADREKAAAGEPSVPAVSETPANQEPDVEIHKAKAVHGWREFINEIGVIVIGVLIALVAEQAVEYLHWRHQVTEGREAVREDLEEMISRTAEREAFSACIGHRLEDVADILAKASGTGRLPPVGDLGGPPKRLWALGSWDTLVAAQVANHFPRDQLLALGGTRYYLSEVAATNLDEFDQWSRLYAIVGPGRRIGEAEIGTLYAALSKANYDAKLMRIAAYQLNEVSIETGLIDKAAIARAKRALPLDRFRKNATCQPIGPAPKHYGQAPFRYSLFGPAEQE